jgi:twinkle protein
MVKDARKVPFNIDAIKAHDYVIFVEGEEECMVWHQCGYPSVVSCPNGAAPEQSMNNLEWLDEVWDRFQGKRIYLATDTDGPGKKLRDDLARRFEPENTFIIEYPVKDANDTLLGHDQAIFEDLFNHAKPVPITEIIDSEDTLATIKYYRKHGYPVGSKLGMPQTDKLYSCNRKELEVFTGVPGHGKSTFKTYSMLRLAVLENWKWGIFSPEHSPELTITRMCEQFMDLPLDKMSESQIDMAFSFIQSHFYFYNITKLESMSLTHLLSLGRSIIKRYGVDGLLFDPFTYIENDQAGETSTDKIGKLLTTLSTFTKVEDVHISLAAHPRKMDKEGGNYQVPRPYDIAGSNNFFNTPDVCCAIHRDYQSEEAGQNISVLHIQKMKLHFRGKPGTVEYTHNVETGTYTEVGSKPISLFELHQRKNNSLLL